MCMINVRRIARIVSYYVSTRDYKYNDPIPKGFLTVDQIPVKIFDMDVMLVNWGISEKHKVHVVTATKLNFNVPHGEM